jgi:hypothetical protein
MLGIEVVIFLAAPIHILKCIAERLVGVLGGRAQAFVIV